LRGEEISGNIGTRGSVNKLKPGELKKKGEPSCGKAQVLSLTENQVQREHTIQAEGQILSQNARRGGGLGIGGRKA